MSHTFSRSRFSQIAASFALALAFAVPAAAQDDEPAGKAKLGIAPANVTAGVGDATAADGDANALRQIMESFDGQLIDAFNKTRKFDIVSRSDLETVLKEQDFAASGIVNASDEQAAQMFQVAGCKYMVKVTIDSFQNIKETLRLEGAGEVLQKSTLQVGAVVKIYDTTTGVLLDSYNDLIELTEVDEGQPGVSVRGNKLNRNLREAVQEFSVRAASYTSGVIFPAKVAAVRSGTLFINRGEGSGIAAGQIWTVYLVDGGIVDPDTGEVLGQVELPLGDVRITRVLPKLSQATSLDGSDPGFETGMIVRPAQSGAVLTIPDAVDDYTP